MKDCPDCRAHWAETHAREIDEEIESRRFAFTVLPTFGIGVIVSPIHPATGLVAALVTMVAAFAWSFTPSFRRLAERAVNDIRNSGKSPLDTSGPPE